MKAWLHALGGSFNLILRAEAADRKDFQLIVSGHLIGLWDERGVVAIFLLEEISN